MTSSRQLPPLASKLPISYWSSRARSPNPHRLPPTARGGCQRWNRALCLGRIQPYKLADVLKGFCN
jgi:hypothetical protein